MNQNDLSNIIFIRIMELLSDPELSNVKYITNNSKLLEALFPFVTTFEVKNINREHLHKLSVAGARFNEEDIKEICGSDEFFAPNGEVFQKPVDKWWYFTAKTFREGREKMNQSASKLFSEWFKDTVSSTDTITE
jgi:hypothetical protein